MANSGGLGGIFGWSSIPQTPTIYVNLKVERSAMATKLSGTQIVKIDEVPVNARILARDAKVDFRGVEAASIKLVTRLPSAEGKRLFVRFFSTLQLITHSISVLARTRLDSDDVAKVEVAIKA